LNFEFEISICSERIRKEIPTLQNIYGNTDKEKISEDFLPPGICHSVISNEDKT
jgi:hypothetical protein